MHKLISALWELPRAAEDLKSHAAARISSLSDFAPTRWAVVKQDANVSVFLSDRTHVCLEQTRKLCRVDVRLVALDAEWAGVQMYDENHVASDADTIERDDLGLTTVVVEDIPTEHIAAVNREV